MGINGLWDVIRESSQEKAFIELGVHEGLHAGGQDIRPVRVGIDASILFHQAAHVFHGPSHAFSGQNPELRTTFYQLCRFRRYPGIFPVYVFDGPDRPITKRGVQVRAKPHWLVRLMKELIEAFGFSWHQAPGEADAELAALSTRGAIDVVLSDDVDCLVFGATRVIRRKGVEEDLDNVNVYSQERIAEIAGLSRAGLILFALLRGGDYDLVGVERCGVTIAHALAKAGFGDRLLHAYETMSEDDFHGFLLPFRNQVVEELESNSTQLMSCRWPAVAKNVKIDWPYRYALWLYLKPVTTWSRDPNAAVSFDTFPRSPDMPKIASFCRQHFSWDSDGSLAKKLQTQVWPGMLIDKLLTEAGNSCGTILSINTVRVGPRYAPSTIFYQICPATSVYKAFNKAISSGELDSPPVKVWVPRRVIECTYASLVHNYERRLKKSIVLPDYSSVLLHSTLAENIGDSTQQTPSTTNTIVDLTQDDATGSHLQKRPVKNIAVLDLTIDEDEKVTRKRKANVVDGEDENYKMPVKRFDYNDSNGFIDLTDDFNL